MKYVYSGFFDEAAFAQIPQADCAAPSIQGSALATRPEFGTVPPEPAVTSHLGLPA
jgi:hypothetical protein